jgi:uncharacterized Zn-binding protein involved in type VI secretion
MPFPIHTLATQANCPHGAKATFIATSSKVLIEGAPAMLEGDQAMIAGCPFTVPTGKPQPCIKAKLEMKAQKVRIEGKGVILQGPADLCESAEQIPQGPVTYATVQTKVLVT